MSEKDEERKKFMFLKNKSIALIKEAKERTERIDKQGVDKFYPLYKYAMINGRKYREAIRAIINIPNTKGTPDKPIVFLTLLEQNKFSVPGTKWGERTITEFLLKKSEEE